MDCKVFFETERACHRIHTYYKGSPYSTDDTSILYTKIKDINSPAQICLMNRQDGTERIIGDCTGFDYHRGGVPYFCDGGQKVIYRKSADSICLHDLKTGVSVFYKGSVCNYSGCLDQNFIEIDEDFDLSSQGRMGVYLRSIDGKKTTLLADIETLLKIHPLGYHVRVSQMLLRVGGEISPDQKKVLLFLVSRNGTLVRDYFVFDLESKEIEFIGRLGCHIMWYPDSIRIGAFVKPWATDLGGLSAYEIKRNNQGLLCMYDTIEKRLTVLSDYVIDDGCHVSPSPLGDKVVLDSYDGKKLQILCYDMFSGKMEELFRARQVQVMENGIGVSHKFNPHPVFSPDGKRVIFNSCTDGLIKLCELAMN